MVDVIGKNKRLLRGSLAKSSAGKTAKLQVIRKKQVNWGG